ncbi:hypothetical protein MKX03_003387 [Papaver bracteatum]|nr:hypothetical protein MKX03_003387 [Papaver bracteatum]
MAALFKLECMVLAFIVVVAPYAAEGAVSCSTVRGKLSPCLDYLAGGPLNPQCCPGLQGPLNPQCFPDAQKLQACTQF